MNDKPENRKTITIKINGKDRPFHNKEIENYSDREEFASFHKERNMDKERSVFTEEAAAGSETLIEEESFDWILPAKEETNTKEKKTAIPLEKTSKPNIWKNKSGTKKQKKEKSYPKGMVASIFFAVFFAVILGTSFGFILLKMVDSEEGIITTTANTITNNNTKSGQTVASTVTATKQELTTYIIQHNVFSSEEKAKKDQQQLMEDDIMSQIISVNDNQVVVLGVSSNLNDAKTWQKQMDGSYAKEITFPGGEIKNVTEAEKAFIEGAPKLYEAMIVVATDARFNNSVDSDALKQVKDLNATLDKKTINAFGNKKIKKMAIELSEGASLAARLTSDSSVKEINVVQEHLLAYLAEYTSVK